MLLSSEVLIIVEPGVISLFGLWNLEYNVIPKITEM